MEKILIGIIGTLMSTGIGWLIKGQSSIRKESRLGREAIHKKLDIYVSKLTVLETEHSMNHPKK